MRTALVVLLLCCPALAQESTPSGQTPKHPAPAAADLRAAQASIREIFKQDYEEASSDEKKVTLATRLIEVAQGTKDNLVSRYALFLEARQLAAEGGHLDFALHALLLIEKEYAAEVFDLKAESVETVAGSARTDEQQGIAEKALALAPQAAAAENFAAARRLVEVAKSSGRKARNLQIVRSAADLETSVAELEAGQAEAARALTILQTNPNDAAANLTVGRFRCLLIGKWETGLPYLARGGDGELQKLARTDLTNPQEPIALRELAGGWWDLAEKESGEVQRHLRLRAAHWYETGLSKFSGISRKIAEKRLQEIREVATPKAPPPATGPVTNKGRSNAGLSSRSESNRKKLAASEGATKESEAAVELALEWLEMHQTNAGGWSFQHGEGNRHQGPVNNPGTEKSTTASTAMALLPFLGAGYTHRGGPHKTTISRGLSYLRRQVKPNGDLRGLEGGSMYCHGLATIALCEAYAMTKDRLVGQPAQLAVQFIANAQDRTGGGWRYSPGQPGDTSVLGWQLTSLKTAQWGGLEVPERILGGANNFLNAVQSNGGAMYGYTSTGSGPATTAIGLLSRIHMNWKKKDIPSLRQGVEYLTTRGPYSNNIYYNYYASQVLYQWGGDEWKKWNEKMRNQLVASQVTTGTAAADKGSWWTRNQSHGERGGRLYETSLSALTLEVYYRYFRELED